MDDQITPELAGRLMMSSVSQKAFVKSVLDPSIPPIDGLAGPHGQPVGKRFDVYRNNVVLGLCDTLGEGFPVVKKLVGDDFFKAMAKVFVRQFPPSSPILMLYGTDFPGFLETFPPVSHLTYLPDMARLEQARRVSYHAKDTPPIDPNSLKNVPLNHLLHLRFNFALHVQMIQSPHPINAIWQANIQDQSSQSLKGPDHLVIARPKFDVQCYSVSQTRFTFYQMLKSGAPLEQAYDTALLTEPEFDLANCLAEMLNLSLVSGIITP